MEIDLTGKTALVCGSTQGIGLATAIELASLGAKVVAMARNSDSLKKVVGSLPGNDLNHDYLVADFTRPQLVRKAIDEFLEENKGIHILINNTGGPPGGKAYEADPEEYRVAFNQHLVSNQVLVQALVPFMIEQGYGRIINIISTSVKIPISGLGVSNTIRGAVANWSKTLANELGTFGITVNNVLPGSTKTGRLDSIFNSKAQKEGISVEQVMEMAKKEIPAGRFADPSEVAYAIAFLSSPAASYINGINLPVDGGRTGSL